MKQKIDKQIFNLHILVGLPGSGKTYWATHNYPTSYMSNHTGRMIVNLDKYINQSAWIIKALNEEFINYLRELHYDELDICIDGPIFSNDNVCDFINAFMSYVETNSGHGLGSIDYHMNIIIHQWNENRDACIHNDNARNRDIKASVTIKNTPYKKIDLKHIYDYITNLINLEYPDKDITFNVKPIIQHEVMMTTNYEQIFEPACDNKYGHGNDEQGRYMYSEDWSLGGEWGNCWGGHGNVAGEEPKEFVELDDFLEKICPNISFLQYKKIKNHCVEMIEWHVPDYYSSGTDDACWRCDMRKLYDMLKEMNYIED